MVANATRPQVHETDAVHFLDRIWRANYPDQLRLWHWLLVGGLPPAAIQGREKVYQGMTTAERRRFRWNAARFVRAPKDGVGQVVPE